jgi:hypothetical protein
MKTVTVRELCNDGGAVLDRVRTFVLKPRASVTLHTGVGTNTSTNLYGGSRAYIGC